ncbi:MAG: hypothetical protein EOP06_02760 [Proteobacteria bacterium]|nr:MAG: hypothetical protein EOP06_02760 [Pseudomonadota bacterium]
MFTYSIEVSRGQPKIVRYKDGVPDEAAFIYEDVIISDSTDFKSVYESIASKGAEISLEGQYTTRSGRPVRILSIDRKHWKYPVVALVLDSDSQDEFVKVFTNSGRAYSDDQAHEDDLIRIQ